MCVCVESEKKYVGGRETVKEEKPAMIVLFNEA